MSLASSKSERSPLATPLFRALWIATVVSNIGTWMHDVGAGWLMTSLSPSPLMVALVQAATTLPMFLLALPAGAMADIVDRRWMLLFAQSFGILAAATLAVLTWLGFTTPAILLAATFALGVAAALSAPVFQAIVPELVDKAVLPDAIALNSLGVNIARAIGPALCGVVVAMAGPPAVFAINSLSVLAVLFVVGRWRREPSASRLPPEHFLGALKAGYRYARRAPALRIVLIRAVGFFIFGSALWAMLPLIARRELGLDAAGYGALLGCMGAGAVLGALLLKRIRAKVGSNLLSIGGTLLFALVMVSLGRAPNVWVAGGVMVAAGLAWIAMLTSLNAALALAARNASDLTPSGHWVEPATAGRVAGDRGPVLVEIEYRIDVSQLSAFVAKLREFKPTRQRDGAIRWDVWEDLEEPGRVVETFVVESWLEHQRQHARVTRTDQLDQEVINAFHLGDGGPKVRHLLAPMRPAKPQAHHP